MYTLVKNYLKLIFEKYQDWMRSLTFYQKAALVYFFTTTTALFRYSCFVIYYRTWVPNSAFIQLTLLSYFYTTLILLALYFLINNDILLKFASRFADITRICENRRRSAVIRELLLSKNPDMKFKIDYLPLKVTFLLIACHVIMVLGKYASNPDIASVIVVVTLYVVWFWFDTFKLERRFRSAFLLERAASPDLAHLPPSWVMSLDEFANKLILNRGAKKSVLGSFAPEQIFKICAKGIKKSYVKAVEYAAPISLTVSLAGTLNALDWGYAYASGNTSIGTRVIEVYVFGHYNTSEAVRQQLIELRHNGVDVSDCSRPGSLRYDADVIRSKHEAFVEKRDSIKNDLFKTQKELLMEKFKSLELERDAACKDADIADKKAVIARKDAEIQSLHRQLAEHTIKELRVELAESKKQKEIDIR